MGGLSFIDLIIILGMAQGIFLAITLSIVYKKNNAANTILSVLLIMACLMLVARIAALKIYEDWVLQWINIADTLIFLFGPLGYLYFRRLLVQEAQRFKLSFLHYTPAIMHGLSVLYFFQYSAHTYKTFYFSGKLNTPFLIIESLGIVLNLYYWYRCRQVFINYRQNEKDQLSFSQQIIPFIRIVLSTMLLFLFVWLISFLSLNVFGMVIPYVNYHFIWIFIPILIYVVGFYALKQPEIFRISMVKDEGHSFTKNRLAETEIESLKMRLENLIEKKQVYLKNELTLQDLSYELKTSTNNLSWLLNNVYKRSFYDYINQFRIAAFLQKVHNKEHRKQTLLSLSMEVGFNSKSTFNKAFKAAVNDTPSGYIKKMNI